MRRRRYFLHMQRPTADEYRQASISPATRKSYQSHMNQFYKFLRETNRTLNLNCYEEMVNHIESFLVHKSYRIKGGSVENCKSGIIKFFKHEHNLYNENNLGQDPRIVELISGVKKTKHRSGQDSDLHAFPIKLFHVKELIEQLNGQAEYVKRYYTTLFIFMYVGCFRQNEAVELLNKDCCITKNEDGVERVTLRLVWHKTSQTNNGHRSSIPVECVRHLYEHYPLMPVTSYKYLLDWYRTTVHVPSQFGYVFPSYTYSTSGQVIISQFNKMNVSVFASMLKEYSLINVNLPRSITSHSFRRGGAVHRLWRAKNKLDIDELMAWCRWDSTDTAAVYLLNSEMANFSDPSDKLNPKYYNDQCLFFINLVINSNDTTKVIDYSKLASLLLEEMRNDRTFKPFQNVNNNSTTTALPANVLSIQTKIDSTSMVYRNFPRHLTNENLFKLWHFGDESKGIKEPLKKMNSKQFKKGADRNNFNEKCIVGRVFNQFSSFEDYLSKYHQLKGFKKARDYFRHNNCN